jgi:hypothetical protein
MRNEPWRIERRTHRARSGRERNTFYVVRGTGAGKQFVLAGFTDEPQKYIRHREAKEMMDLLNAGGEQP